MPKPDPRRLRLLKERQAKINTAQAIIDKLRPSRDLLIRDLIGKGLGIRELADQIDAYPSTVTRICQKDPAVVPANKPGWSRS